MLLYWFFGLIMVVPLAGIAALLRRVVRPYASLRTLTLWVGLCLVDGLCFWVLYHADNRTVYASGYSEARFEQVTAGMSQARVRTLLGEPLERWWPYRWTNYAAKRHYVSYDYSRSENGEGDYEIRQIHFDRGRVAEVVRYRYYD